MIAAALALVACAAPKAVVVEDPAALPKLELAAVESDVAATPAAPALPDDGLRMPDMLAMPGDIEFRATSPMLPAVGGDTSAVIARPPTDPPSRPKPPKENEPR